jgi:hypothetical protein
MYNVMYIGTATMIRKQIYIARRQEQVLKRLSRARNVSEAAVIREAIDRQADAVIAMPVALDATAWDEALLFMSRRSGRRAAKPRHVRREDAYADRLRRWR